MTNSIENNTGIVIYQTDDGKTQIDVKLHSETVWLTQKQMAELFQKNRTVITRHINNVFNEGELDKNMVCAKIAHTTPHGAIAGKQQVQDVVYYNLDVIISVGYRVKSQRGTQFRIWATQVLKRYLTEGYALNELRLKQEKDRIACLQQTINLLSRTLANQIENIDQAQEIAHLLNTFAQGLDLLDDYDHQTLKNVGMNKREAVRISEQDYLSVIEKMKSAFASAVFATPKDGSFASSINQIYQTFGGKDLYPTLEEKAAMLLYLITKNHSFADGNKRIAASCFLYFLDRNKILFCDGHPVIDNHTLFTLTLLIAESKPDEREIIQKVILSVLNGIRGIKWNPSDEGKI